MVFRTAVCSSITSARFRRRRNHCWQQNWQRRQNTARGTVILWQNTAPQGSVQSRGGKSCSTSKHRSSLRERRTVNTGEGRACWLERRTRDRKVASSNPGRSGGRNVFSRVYFVFWLLLVSDPPLCYRSGTWKTPVILPKVQVAGYT